MHPQPDPAGGCGWRRRPSGSNSAAASTSCRCGTRSGWPKTMRWPTSSPTDGSSWASAAAITPARSRPSAAPLLDTEANREIFEEGLQLLLKCFNEESFRHKGKYFECPPRGAVSRLRARTRSPGAAAEASAGRDLDADRQRPHDRHDGAIRPQGDGDAERREDPRRRGARLSRRLPAPRPRRRSSART